MATNVQYQYQRVPLLPIDTGALLRAYDAARAPLAMAAKKASEPDSELIAKLAQVYGDVARGGLNLAGISAQVAGGESKTQQQAQASIYASIARLEGVLSHEHGMDRRQARDLATQVEASKAVLETDKPLLETVGEAGRSNFESAKASGRPFLEAVQEAAATLGQGAHGSLGAEKNVIHKEALLDRMAENFRRDVGFSTLPADQKAQVDAIIEQQFYHANGANPKLNKDGVLSAVSGLADDGLFNQTLDIAAQGFQGGIPGKPPLPAMAPSGTPAPSAAPAATRPVPPIPAGATAQPPTRGAPAPVGITAAPVAAGVQAPAGTSAAPAPAPVASYSPTTPMLPNAIGQGTPDPNAVVNQPTVREAAIRDTFDPVLKAAIDRYVANSASPAANGQIGLDLRGTYANPDQARADALRAKLDELRKDPEKWRRFEQRLQAIKMANGHLTVDAADEERLGADASIRADQSTGKARMTEMAKKDADEWNALQRSIVDGGMQGTSDAQAKVQEYLNEKATVLSVLTPMQRQDYGAALTIDQGGHAALDTMVKQKIAARPPPVDARADDLSGKLTVPGGAVDKVTAPPARGSISAEEDAGRHVAEQVFRAAKEQGPEALLDAKARLDKQDRKDSRWIAASRRFDELVAGMEDPAVALAPEVHGTEAAAALGVKAAPKGPPPMPAASLSSARPGAVQVAPSVTPPTMPMEAGAPTGKAGYAQGSPPRVPFVGTPGFQFSDQEEARVRQNVSDFVKSQNPGLTEADAQAATDAQMQTWRTNRLRRAEAEGASP